MDILFNFNDADRYLVGFPLCKLLKYFESTEIIRQSEDQAFALALNRMVKFNSNYI